MKTNLRWKRMRRIEKSWKEKTWRARVLIVLFFFSLQFLPLVFSPVLAEASLPACCRTHGKHHCVMNKELFTHNQDSHSSQITQVREKCPFSAATPVGLHGPDFSLDVCDLIFAEIVSGPLLRPRMGTPRRTSLDRSCQKRGPPSISLLPLLF